MREKIFTENGEEIVRKKISLITFVCSIFVIYLHSYNLKMYGIDELSIGMQKIIYSVEQYNVKIIRIAVPMFFLISGMLFFRTFEIKTLITKWKRRFFSLVIPYVIWCSLYYFYFVFSTNSDTVRSIMNGSVEIELSVENWIRWLWIDKYYTLWFLQNLILYVVISPVLFLLLKNRNRKYPTGLIVPIVVVYIIQTGMVNSDYLNGFSYYIVGSYIGINCKEYINKRSKIVSIISVVYILIQVLSGFYFWNVFLEIVYLIAIWFALDYICLEKIKVKWWMQISFFTYVSHDVFLQAYKKIVWLLFGNREWIILPGYFLIPIVVELTLILIAYLLKKHTPHVWKCIVGLR